MIIDSLVDSPFFLGQNTQVNFAAVSKHNFSGRPSRLLTEKTSPSAYKLPAADECASQFLPELSMILDHHEREVGGQPQLDLADQPHDAEIVSIEE